MKPLSHFLGGPLRHHAARAVNGTLRRFGYQIVRDDTLLDLREVTDDPIEALYLAGGRPFVVDVTLASCRGLWPLAFPCASGAGHPFIETLEAYRAGRCQEYRGSPAEKFYHAWTAADAAAALGLPSPDISEALKQAPPFIASRILPWGCVDPATVTKKCLRLVELGNCHHGAESAAHHVITPVAGPLSEAKGALEFQRLKRVTNSILANGYRRSGLIDGDIGGYLLIHKNEWVLALLRGHHRAAALAALGHAHAPVRVCKTWWQASMAVRREDFASWPNVRSGLFTRKQALDLFDRTFAGRQPDACARISAMPAHDAVIKIIACSHVCD